MPDATELALRALRHRDRSRQELALRLAREGIPADEREEVLDALAGSGVVSDERYAHERARSLASRNAGNALILAELRRHGIGEETASTALEGLQDEAERAARIFERRGGGERALRYLAGKGFGRETLEALATRDSID